MRWRGGLYCNSCATNWMIRFTSITLPPLSTSTAHKVVDTCILSCCSYIESTKSTADNAARPWQGERYITFVVINLGKIGRFIHLTGTIAHSRESASIR